MMRERDALVSFPWFFFFSYKIFLYDHITNLVVCLSILTERESSRIRENARQYYLENCSVDALIRRLFNHVLIGAI